MANKLSTASRYLAFFISFICIISVHACNQQNTSSSSEVDPNLSESEQSSGKGPITQSLSAWEKVEGLDGGIAQTVTWKGDELVVGTKKSGIYYENGGDSLELLHNNAGFEEKDAFSLSSKIYYHGNFDRLFLLNTSTQARTLFYSDGAGWVNTNIEAGSLLLVNQKLYLRTHGAVLVSDDGLVWSTYLPIAMESAGGVTPKALFTVGPNGKAYIHNTNGFFEWGPQDQLLKIINLPAHNHVSDWAVSSHSGLLYVVLDSNALLVRNWNGSWAEIYNANDSFIRSVRFGEHAGEIYLLHVPGNQFYYIGDGEEYWLETPPISSDIRDWGIEDGQLWLTAAEGLWVYESSNSEWISIPLPGVNSYSIASLYEWNDILFAEIEGEEVCDYDVCYLPYDILKQVSPGKWEQKDETDAFVTPTASAITFPDDTPKPTHESIQFEVEGRCILAVASDEGLSFYEKSFGWHNWSNGLPSYGVKDFVYIEGEKALYAATTHYGLFKLNLENVLAVNEEEVGSEGDGPCTKKKSVGITFGN